MEYQEIIKKLKTLANLKNVKAMARFGINSKNTLGVSVPVIRKMAKRIGRNHKLALQLWDSKIHEARLLAGFIDEFDKVTEKQMEKWVKDFDSWDICDQICGNLFDKTPFVYKKIFQWAERKEEFVKRTAFVLMATLSVHDKKAKDKDFEKFFPLIKKHSTDERNFVKKAVNWALRQIGKRNFNLNKKAIKLAQEIQSRPGAAKSAKWIASNAFKELISPLIKKKICVRSGLVLIMRVNLKYISIIIFLALFSTGALLFYSWKIGEEIDSIVFKRSGPILKIKDEDGPRPFSLIFFEDVRKEFFLTGKDFLEIHLDKMKIRLYKSGLLVKEVPILIKGDPDGWGGSAIGLYKIMSGNKVSFSNIANVYMPYALHYYGKYYIHGEPYYYGGEKLQSSFSGGCLRLNNKDAKLIYDLSELNMPVLVIDKERDYYDYSKEKISRFPELSAKSYLIADLDSGYILAEKNPQEELPIASLTKLMTAIIIAENVNLERTISVREEMLNVYGSTKGLEPGSRFRVVELFYPLLIESSNDAAEVLSYFLGREKTIRLMNEKAPTILMKKTKFTDPSGYDPGNVSTAQDLFYLARYLLNNRSPILEITKGRRVTSFGPVGFNIEELWNKNVFIDDPTLVGGKTGFIKNSKLTAVFVFRFADKNNQSRNIAIILLGSDSNKNDTHLIYKWLQDNFFGQQYIL